VAILFFKKIEVKTEILKYSKTLLRHVEVNYSVNNVWTRFNYFAKYNPMYCERLKKSTKKCFEFFVAPLKKYLDIWKNSIKEIKEY